MANASIAQADATPMRCARDWGMTLPVLALLIAQVGLYVCLAPRGFDFTDESYYFLNYLHWREFTGALSFFGAYLEWPFRLLGQSVSGIRIFGLALLLACSAFFTREALSYWARREGSESTVCWPFILVGMAASLFYFSHLSTLRAPSYNLLALCSMLMATGLLFRLLEQRGPIVHARATMFFYGVALGVCGLSKASSGVLLILSHALFFMLANREWRVNHLAKLLTLSLAGVLANFVALQWAHPQWLPMLLQGVSAQGMDGSHGLPLLVAKLGRNILEMLPQLVPLAVAAEIGVAWLAKRAGAAGPHATSILVVAIVGACSVGLIWGSPHWWLPLLGLVALLLWTVGAVSRASGKSGRDTATNLALMVLLISLPIAYSFGTNMSVLDHSQMAAVFPLTAITLQLVRLYRLGLLRRIALIACLTALCLPTLAIQFRAATDIQHTYRQLSALADQTLPVQIGSADTTLLVDAETRKTLHSVINAARAAGFVHGETILDFTGDGPGLIYALGGRPLGKAWLLGGLKGSPDMAKTLVEKLPGSAVRSAWLLSSDNNPRAIKGWPQLLEARVGPDSHELVATVTIRAPYRWGEGTPDRLSVQIWKPRSPTLPSAAGPS